MEIADGIRRVTFPLPLGIDHVHCYAVPASDGSWTLVDTGLAADDPEAAWGPFLASLGGPVERIVVTHLHPDHVGGAADVAALTGGRVHQGRRDHEQTLAAWGDPANVERGVEHFRAHGVPEAELDRMRVESAALRARVRFAREVEPLDPGDTVDGWEVLEVPGHADGHIALHRDGVLLAGDAILGRITPTVGLYQQGRPDPLGDYLESLERIGALGARVAYAGHEQPVHDPAGRVAELRAHHAERIAAAASALGREPRSAYVLSHVLFPARLAPSQRRFAVAETLAHLERLVVEGRAARAHGGYRAV